MVEFRRTTGKK